MVVRRGVVFHNINVNIFIFTETNILTKVSKLHYLH